MHEAARVSPLREQATSPMTRAPDLSVVIPLFNEEANVEPVVAELLAALEAGLDCEVLLVDDLLATGGTMGAAVKLVRAIGGKVVACAFVIELTAIGGRSRLDVPVHALVQY